MRQGEANLPRASVVNISQIVTVDRAKLVELVGTLGAERMRAALQGLALLFGTDRLAGD